MLNILSNNFEDKTLESNLKLTLFWFKLITFDFSTLNCKSKHNAFYYRLFILFQHILIIINYKLIYLTYKNKDVGARPPADSVITGEAENSPDDGGVDLHEAEQQERLVQVLQR